MEQQPAPTPNPTSAGITRNTAEKRANVAAHAVDKIVRAHQHPAPPNQTLQLEANVECLVYAKRKPPTTAAFFACKCTTGYQTEIF